MPVGDTIDEIEAVPCGHSMSVSRLLSRRGLSPAAIVLLLITAMVGGGLEIRPAPAAGCSIEGGGTGGGSCVTKVSVSDHSP